MSEKNELLPCPFCGEKAQVVRDEGVYFKCSGLCMAQSGRRATYETALELWNRRTPAHSHEGERDLTNEEASKKAKEVFGPWGFVNFNSAGVPAYSVGIDCGEDASENKVFNGNSFREAFANADKQ